MSSEANYDFLVFYIDGVEQDRWSGDLGWNSKTFETTAGQHSYTWAYIKDYSVNGGTDAAWIDYIMLPPHLDETEEQAILPLTLHPNPTSDQVTVGLEREGDFILKVFDANGKLIVVQRNDAVVSFKGRPSGLYHIVIEQSGRLWSRKVVKM